MRRSEWRNEKTNVLTCEEIKLLHLGIVIPAGTSLRVIKPISKDAAEVEWQGTAWVEIFIADQTLNCRVCGKPALPQATVCKNHR